MLIKAMCLTLVLTCLAVPLRAIELTYPQKLSTHDARSEFTLALLRLILSQSESQVILRPSKLTATQERTLLMLADHQLDILWIGSSIQREEDFRAIPIPLYKGLLGWRIMLLHAQNAEMLKGLCSLQALRQFSVGLGGGWPEIPLFSDSGFTVHTTTTYDGLFQMLEKRRFDLFPRSIIEIWSELDSFASPHLVADPYVIVRYPAANYFFVNKDNEALAQLIERNFYKILKDGQYQSLFDSMLGPLISRSQLDKRCIIDIPNRFFQASGENIFQLPEPHTGVPAP